IQPASSTCPNALPSTGIDTPVPAQISILIGPLPPTGPQHCGLAPLIQADRCPGVLAGGGSASWVPGGGTRLGSTVTGPAESSCAGRVRTPRTASIRATGKIVLVVMHPSRFESTATRRLAGGP